MNKSELIKAINGKVEGASLKQTEEHLNAFLQVVEESIENNENIQLTGHVSIGTRYKKPVDAKLGVNPQDPKGEKIEHKAQPEKMIPFIKIGKKLKDAALKAPIVK